MNRGLALTVVALGAVVAAPLVLPVAELAARPSGLLALAETRRLTSLLFNSLTLAAAAVLLAVPAGVVAAVLLERTRAPAAGLVRAATAVGLFVPLPVYAAAWQAALGSGGWLGPGAGLPDVGGWRPWREGLTPAVWVHAVAGLPWVVWVVSLSLRNADRRLEEDALLAGGRRAVGRWVLGPRVAASAAAAAGWVAVQAFTETTVTDVMMVRTFAEEVYFQLVAAPDAVPAAVAVTLPVWAASAAIAVWLVRRAARAAPVIHASVPVARPLWEGWLARTAAAVVLWGGTAILVGIPVAALVAKANVNGDLFGQLTRVAHVHGATLADSILWSAVAGLVAAGLALVACYHARRSRWFAGLLLVLAAVAWLTPTPLVGLGLKNAIDALLSVEDAILLRLGLAPMFPPLRSALYDQPSPLPAVWAAVVRFFPVAVALVWPTVGRLPRELLETAALDGGSRAVWRVVVWPLCRGAFAWAAVVVGALSLGEVVAGKLVQPPGRQSFAQELFNAMHYGADATVAAMCLLQLVVTALAVLILFHRRA
jgi:iron(III) transport system permease protein